MRFRPTLNLAVACVFGLAALPMATGPARAQDFVPPAALNGHDVHHSFGLGAHCATPRAVIPRSFSYQYDTWFNQPRHVRYQGPDGRTYWRTTVRGLPMGTPWPSY